MGLNVKEKARMEKQTHLPMQNLIQAPLHKPLRGSSHKMNKDCKVPCFFSYDCFGSFADYVTVDWY